ncbi:MAG: hypothetical protein MJ245_03835 [Clostridia bacterium]|nr:hypothetical protein [Clostridia bacterium]
MTKTIPYIPDRIIMKRGNTIRPLWKIGDKRFYLGNYNLTEMKLESYFETSRDHIMEEVDASKIEAFCELETVHPLFGSRKVRPTIAEIVAQIPREYLDDAIAFELKINGRYNEKMMKGKLTLYRKS